MEIDNPPTGEIINYARFLSAVSAARKPSPLRVLNTLQERSPSNIISLAGGAPNPDTFPFLSASIQVKNGPPVTLDKPLMQRALQYSASNGIPELLTWMKNFQKNIHNPPNPQTDMCVTTGSQEGISKIFQMLVNPGDNVLLDTPTYPDTLSVLQPLGCNLINVSSDEHGMIPEALRTVLSRWSPSDVHKSNSSAPKVLYTIPNGGNPTGASMTEQRKREVYQLARQYDMLIIEDDPYYFLQFDKPWAPTFLSMDVDGRVIRTDSFSKILSAGLRLGFVTGPKPLVDRVVLHIQSSTMHTSSFTQLMVSQLLHSWGEQSFLQHIERVTEFYLKQRSAMISSAEKWLKDVAEWRTPAGGMFLWIKLKRIRDTRQLIWEKAVEKEVLLVPGAEFMINSEEPSPYIRAAFSLSSPQQIDEAFRRLSLLIREAQG